MTAKTFYDWQTAGGGGDVTRAIAVLERLGVPWCVIGGIAVNHWAEEPVVTADVDMVVALESVETAVGALVAEGFIAERFPWSVNLKGSSRVSIQISTEERYRDYPSRSIPADVWGILMRVASLEDTLNGKIAAYSDLSRRPSKRQKDFLDILRLVENNPETIELLPIALRDEVSNKINS
ncbi:MAG: nucleotidyl transferase AbiEii/AbiGii toxin family protein [Kiritimatiellaeota bacterium]|nr:nucleotidyl transferase AbiEii/AbiGii toxin family protein [Kiritimatiellota bacterium]